MSRDPYRPICRHVVLPLWARWEGSRYLQHLEHLERSQYADPAVIRERQWQEVKRLIDHAHAHTRFYRELYDAAGVRPADVRTWQDFQALPVVRKTQVQERAADLAAAGVKPYFPFLTSGSTGTPLRGYRDKECQDFKRACGMRSNFWAGYQLGERIACLYGNPEKELRGARRLKARWRRRLLYRTEILDMLAMSEESMLDFARTLRRRPPALLWGHAHGLSLFARFLERRGIDDIQPKGIYSAGMVLHDFERAAVDRVFRCGIQDRYGCEELGMIAAECKAREGMHINTDALFVELLDAAGRPVGPGERGAIVITDLKNRAMPFIRYRIEDIGVLSARRCSCGRTQPLLDRLEGRVADFLVTPEGRLVSGISLTDHFAGHLPGVRQIQIVQDVSDLLTLRIVRGEDFGDASERAIARLVAEFFGPRMRHELEFAGEIAQGPSGKYRFTVCRVPHGML